MTCLSEEVAWAAGLVDGEGCITVLVGNRTKTTRESYCPRICVRMVTEKAVKKLCTIFGGSYRLEKNHDWKPVFCFLRSGNKAIEVLQQLRDHLVEKQDQADLILSVPWGRESYRTPDDLWQKRKETWIKIQEMHV